MLQVIHAALVVSMLLPVLWSLQTFIKAAPSDKGFSDLVDGCKFVRKMYLKRRNEIFTALIVTDDTGRGNKFS